MTAFAQEGDRDKFIAQGMDDYIAKPIRSNTIIKKIHYWINKNEPLDEEISDSDNNPVVLNMDVINQLKKYGGPELIETTIHDFEIEAKEQIDDCLELINVKNYLEILNKLHTLKGSAGTLGADKIADVAKSVEINIKNDKLDSVGKDLNYLKRCLLKFSEHQKRLLNYSK